MLESRSRSTSGVKLEEFVVERSLWLDALSLNWLGVIGGSHYMDFGEVDSLALHPYNTKRVVE